MMTTRQPTRYEIKMTIGQTLPLLGDDCDNFQKWCAVFRLAEPYLGEEGATELANEFEAEGYVYKIKI